jgi:HK97 family phage major capsid protein
MKKKMPPKNKQSHALESLRNIEKAAADGKVKLGMQHRAATIENIDEESRTVELSFSSETGVERWGYVEILDHKKSSVRLDWLKSGRAPFLADHNPNEVIGVVETASIKSSSGRATVRFSKSAEGQRFFEDVKDKIRTNISVGYRIHKVVLESEEDDTPTYRATDWEPFEISLVSIPADQSVGIGRNESGGAWEVEVVNNNLEKREMDPKEKDKANATPVPASNPTDNLNSEREAMRKSESQRTKDIMSVAKAHDMFERGMEFIAEGKTVDQFREYVLSNLGTAKPIQSSDNSNELGLSQKEARQYSFLRAFNAASQGNWKGAEYEREVSEATAQKYPRRAFKGNLQIPVEVLAAQMGAGQRDLNVGNSAQGGYLVGTDLKSGSFIELLRNKLLVRQLGATVLTGLEGDVAIPKQTAGATAYWLDENESAPESQQSIGQVKMSPHTVGAFTELSRRLLLQSSIDAEQFVRADLAAVIATAIDKAALKGTGADGQPTGILNTTGINTVSISTGTYTLAKLIDLETEVGKDNAEMGKLAYLSSVTDRGIMKKTDEGTDTGKRIWSNATGQPGAGEVNGYPAFATNQLAADETIFGNWQDLIIGEWSVLDVLVNPYSNDKSGAVRITALQDVDIAVRHPESFARTTV